MQKKTQQPKVDKLMTGVMIVWGLLAIAFLAYDFKTSGNPFFSRIFAQSVEKISANSVAVSNQDAGNMTTSNPWIGNGESKDNSYTVLMFNNVQVVKGSSVKGASIEFTSPTNQWIETSFVARAKIVENSDSGVESSYNSAYSSSLAYSKNEKWISGKRYKVGGLENAIQQIVNNEAWEPGKSIMVILKGTGNPYARKFIGTGDKTKLLVEFSSNVAEPTMTPTPVPTSTPTPVPTPTPSGTQEITNPGFENSLTGWQVSGTSVVQTAHSGTNAAKLTNTSAYISQNIASKLKENQAYVFSAYVKVSKAGTSWGVPTLRLSKYKDLGSSDFGQALSVNKVDSNWQQIKVTKSFTSSELSSGVYLGIRNFGFDGESVVDDFLVTESGTASPTPTPTPMITPTPVVTVTPVITPTPTPMPTHIGGMEPVAGESMAMMAWGPNGKNIPNSRYDKCDDGTNVVDAHNQYYVVAYDGLKYPTWHPPVVTNPITGSGRCYFGHEHGSNPQSYIYWNDIVRHFGIDQNGDGVISPLVISAAGVISPGDRAGIPFGISNEHMDLYYNQDQQDSVFVRHEDHVGHKIEIANNESDLVGNTTHPMAQLAGTVGVNIPYGSSVYSPTGVVCTHLHKFHQGTHSGDAILNNLHEVIFHSSCMSVDVNGLNASKLYPKNVVLLTGMMTFGDPGIYKRFCGQSRFNDICGLDGKLIATYNGYEMVPVPGASCTLTDPLLSRLPNSVYSDTLGRNMTDVACLESLGTATKYFNPYEIWQGDLRITTPSGKMLAEHGRQWDVLDPVRLIDIGYRHPTRSWQKDYRYTSEECEGLLRIPGTYSPRLAECGGGNTAWDSPSSPFKGLKRTTYFGRNRVSNSGGAQVWWTDPLGGNAVTTKFTSGLKQMISSVEADICKLSVCSTLNDRALQRRFSDGGGTVHVPN